MCTFHTGALACALGGRMDQSWNSSAADMIQHKSLLGGKDLYSFRALSTINMSHKTVMNGLLLCAQWLDMMLESD